MFVVQFRHASFTMSVPLSPFCLRHEIGDVVKDRYTIRAVLGAGAFGTVYRVEETLGARTLTLACKEMHVLADPATNGDERGEALRAFQEEAYILQTLRHPNIPAAYFEPEKGVWLVCPICGRTFKGVKECPDHGNALEVIRERYYLLMDFIEGPDLEQLLERNGEKPIEEERVLDWSLQVCDALSTVHSKGLSHRDIKPANIKLQEATDRAILIDFGLVKPSAVVGAYGTVLKRKSTGAGTLGYAPELPSEQQRPDARTDILALGMTLYRLLTGLDPTDLADLEKMRSRKPQEENLRLSDALNDIIVKMIAPNPDKRYPDIASVQNDLRSARYPVETKCAHCGHVQRSLSAPAADTRCDQCGRPLAGSPTTSSTRSAPNTTNKQSKTQQTSVGSLGANGIAATQNNPYGQRLRDLRQQIDAPNIAATTTHPNDARIAELETTLRNASKSAARGNTCPACTQTDLLPITSEPNGMCPICVTQRMERRLWDNNKCAVCREGTLQKHTLNNEQMFCAVCRHSVLADEHRRKLGGLISDLWGKCPHCNAVFDIQNGNRAHLETIEADPFGVGTLHKGESLPIAQWRELSGRANEYSECDKCHSQFDVVAPGQKRLSRGGDRDPFGVWAALANQVLVDDDWGKVAAGFELPAGNVHCARCNSEWEYDQAAATLQLLRSQNPLPTWAQNWAGALPIGKWYLGAGGKKSGRAGWFCLECHTEFDTENGGLRLVTAPPSPTLTREIGRVLELRDWQRLGANLPTAEDIARMQTDLARLQSLRRNDLSSQGAGQAQSRKQAQSDWNELLKRSVLEGFLPFRRLSGRAPQPQAGESFVSLRDDANRKAVRASETIRWETPGHLAVAEIVETIVFFIPTQSYQWGLAGSGTLTITSERILFNPWQSGGALWQCSFDQIDQVETQIVQDTMLAIISLRGTSQLIGFDIGEAQLEVIYDGQIYNMSFSPLHLASLLKLIKAGK